MHFRVLPPFVWIWFCKYSKTNRVLCVGNLNLPKIYGWPHLLPSTCGRVLVFEGTKSTVHYEFRIWYTFLDTLCRVKPVQTICLWGNTIYIHLQWVCWESETHAQFTIIYLLSACTQLDRYVFEWVKKGEYSKDLAAHGRHRICRTSVLHEVYLEINIGFVY